MKSLLDNDGYSEIKSRLNNLTEESTRQWGKMTAGQMAHHCQGPLNVLMEKDDYGLKPNWFAKTFFKKAMYNNKPWRKNLPLTNPNLCTIGWASHIPCRVSK